MRRYEVERERAYNPNAFAITVQRPQSTALAVVPPPKPAAAAAAAGPVDQLLPFNIGLVPAEYALVPPPAPESTALTVADAGGGELVLRNGLTHAEWLSHKLALQRRDQLAKQADIMRALSELSENESKKQRAFDAWKENKDRIERERRAAAEQRQYASYQQLALIGALKGRASAQSFAEWKAAKDELLRMEKAKAEAEERAKANAAAESKTLAVREAEEKYKAWMHEKQHQLESQKAAAAEAEASKHAKKMAAIDADARSMQSWIQKWNKKAAKKKATTEKAEKAEAEAAEKKRTENAARVKAWSDAKAEAESDPKRSETAQRRAQREEELKRKTREHKWMQKAIVLSYSTLAIPKRKYAPAKNSTLPATSGSSASVVTGASSAPVIAPPHTPFGLATAPDSMFHKPLSPEWRKRKSRTAATAAAAAAGGSARPASAATKKKPAASASASVTSTPVGRRPASSAGSRAAASDSTDDKHSGLGGGRVPPDSFADSILQPAFDSHSTRFAPSSKPVDLTATVVSTASTHRRSKSGAHANQILKNGEVSTSEERNRVRDELAGVARQLAPSASSSDVKDRSAALVRLQAIADNARVTGPELCQSLVPVVDALKVQLSDTRQPKLIAETCFTITHLSHLFTGDSLTSTTASRTSNSGDKLTNSNGGASLRDTLVKPLVQPLVDLLGGASATSPRSSTPGGSASSGSANSVEAARTESEAADMCLKELIFEEEPAPMLLSAVLASGELASGRHGSVSSAAQAAKCAQYATIAVNQWSMDDLEPFQPSVLVTLSHMLTADESDEHDGAVLGGGALSPVPMDVGGGGGDVKSVPSATAIGGNAAGAGRTVNTNSAFKPIAGAAGGAGGGSPSGKNKKDKEAARSLLTACAKKFPAETDKMFAALPNPTQVVLAREMPQLQLKSASAALSKASQLFANRERRAIADINPRDVFDKVSVAMGGAGGGFVSPSAVSVKNDEVLKLIDSGYNPNTLDPTDDDHHTLLMLAAQTGNDKLVTGLIDRQASKEAQAADGRTALWMAVNNLRTSTVTLLASRGCNIEHKLDEDSGLTPLMSAARSSAAGSRKVLQALIRSGAKLESRDDNGHTALWHACTASIEVSASVLPNVYVLVHAGANSKDPAVAALLKSSSPALRDTVSQALATKEAGGGRPRSSTPTHGMGSGSGGSGGGANALTSTVVRGGGGGLAAAAMDRKDSAGGGGADTIWTAVRAGDLDRVLTLLDTPLLDLDIEARDKDGFTALLVAADAGRAEIVAALHNRGANVQAVDSQAQSALILAVLKGHTGTVDVLLDRGAMIDQPIAVAPHFTALMTAAGCASSGRSRSVLSTLIRHGANIESKDSTPGARTALLIACEAAASNAALLPHVTLLAMHARTDVADNKTGKGVHDWGDAVSAAIRQGIAAGKAAASVASSSGDVRDSKSGSNDSKAWFRAAGDGDVKQLTAILDASSDPQQLIDSGDAEGRTALMCAAGGGHTDAVVFLHNRGADINAVDLMGKNAYLVADMSDNAMLDLLEKRGIRNA